MEIPKDLDPETPSVGTNSLYTGFLRVSTPTTIFTMKPLEQTRLFGVVSVRGTGGEEQRFYGPTNHGRSRNSDNRIFLRIVSSLVRHKTKSVFLLEQPTFFFFFRRFNFYMYNGCYFY